MKGRPITDGEFVLLNVLRLPESLVTILRTDIIGARFYLSESNDRSGLGVEMEWMQPKDQIEEAFDFYPGRVALNNDFIPVGICLKGSGDPYFVKEIEQVLHLYRIPHDSIIDDELQESSIEYVCSLHFLLDNNVARLKD